MPESKHDAKGLAAAAAAAALVRDGGKGRPHMEGYQLRHMEGSAAAPKPCIITVNCEL